MFSLGSKINHTSTVLQKSKVEGAVTIISYFWVGECAILFIFACVFFKESVAR